MSEQDEMEETVETAPAATMEFAAVVPLHAATGNGIKRGPGRPKKINAKPTTDDLLYHAEMARAKAAYIEADPLVQSTRNRQEAQETLHRVKEEVAKEAASLSFAKIEEEKYGRDTSQMSSRRIAALREIASIELEIKKLGATMIDLRSERFQRIFQSIIETIRETASEVLNTEQADLFFNRLGTKLEGWEERAQHL